MELAALARADWENPKAQRGCLSCCCHAASTGTAGKMTSISGQSPSSPRAADRLPQGREATVSPSTPGLVPSELSHHLCPLTSPLVLPVLHLPARKQSVLYLSYFWLWFWLFHGLLVPFTSDKLKPVLPHWTKVKLNSAWEINLSWRCDQITLPEK